MSHSKYTWLKICKLNESILILTNKSQSEQNFKSDKEKIQQRKHAIKSEMVGIFQPWRNSVIPRLIEPVKSKIKFYLLASMSAKLCACAYLRWSDCNYYFFSFECDAWINVSILYLSVSLRSNQWSLSLAAKKRNSI